MNKDTDLKERLDHLGRRIASQPSVLDAVMQRVERLEAPAARPVHRLGRIVMKATMAMAASVLVGIAIWLAATGGTASKVYGMQDFQRRLLTARSYHLKGWYYYERHDRNGQLHVNKVPTEVYAALPCQHYVTGFANHDGVLGTSYTAADHERYIEVDHRRKTCRIGRNYPFATELYVTYFLEQTPRTLMRGDPSSYQQIGRETINGVQADVYEATSSIGPDGRTRSVVWLNPATGVPVRMAAYRQKEGQAERPFVEHDLVEVDAPPPVELFRFEPPAGYKVIHEDRGPESVHNGAIGATVNSVHFDFRFEFNINDRAMLTCWAWYDASTEPWFEFDPDNPPGQTCTVTLGSYTNDRKYRLVPLRDDPAGQFHWHWSLLVPEDGKRIGKDQPRLTFRSEGGSTGGYVSRAWQRLSRETLADFILKAQWLTLPADAPADAALTLEQIEAKIAELTGQP